MSTIAVQNDPCSELDYSRRTTAAVRPARCPPPGYSSPAAAEGAGRGGGFARVGAVDRDRRRVDPQAEGNGRHHRLRPEHRRQEVVGAERQPLARADHQRSALRGRDSSEGSGRRRPARGHHDEDAGHLRHRSQRWCRRWPRPRWRVAPRRAAVAAERGGGPPSSTRSTRRRASRSVRSAIPSVNTAVPMTFLHQGKQYIVFASGTGGPSALIALTLPRGGSPHQ